MAIEIATDNNDLPDEDEFVEEDSTAYNFRQLMDLLIENSDIILTVPADQVEILKKGLYTRKGKDNYKLQKAGIKAGNDVLAFNVYDAPDKINKCVRVKLGPRKSVTVLKVEIPDDAL